MATISLVLERTPDLPAEHRQAMYRITGRSSVEVRRAAASGADLFTVTLFGPEHVHDVPRLEKLMDYLAAHGLAYRLFETDDSGREPISGETFAAIVGG